VAESFSGKKSKPGARLGKDVIELIRTMATANRRWGAERIRGELLKLGYTAAKSTIQRYLARFRGLAPGGQRWSTFLPCSGYSTSTGKRDPTRALASGDRTRSHKSRAPRPRSPYA
jgi:hypothetical protein